VQYFFQKTYIKTGKNYFLKIYLPLAPICVIGVPFLLEFPKISNLWQPWIGGTITILKISNIQGFFFAETNIYWG